MTASAPRVAVLGGGLLGVATTAKLAAAGARVTLLTDGALCSGATGRSLSWLNSFYPTTASYHRLRLRGLRCYRDRLARPGAHGHIRFHGGLQWYSSGNEHGLRRAFEHLRTVGYEAEWLTSDEVARRVPGIDPGAVPPTGAVFAPAEGWVDLPSLVEGLAAEAVAAGARLLTGVGPGEAVLDGTRVTGVATADGTAVGADAVVLATGTSIPADLARFDVSVPDASGSCLLVSTRPVAHPLAAVLNSPTVSLRRGIRGEFVMDSSVSAARLVEGADGAPVAPRDAVDELLASARDVLAGRPELTVASVRTGRKPIPGGDGHSVVGAVPGIDGLYAVFTHSGATLGLALAELLAREVLVGDADPLLDDVRLTRFG